jgi:hypothetical protein
MQLIEIMNKQNLTSIELSEILDRISDVTVNWVGTPLVRAWDYDGVVAIDQIA